MPTVIDYESGFGGFGSAARVKDAGHDGIMRYISHNPSKDLTPAERDEARAVGLTIGLVFESAANRASQGYAAGLADGRYANQRADALGYPESCTLWFAVDFDGDVSMVQPYFDGVAAAGGRAFAPYGGARIIDQVTYPGIGWQTVAWSHNKVSARAGLLQNGFHGPYDTNEVLKADYGQWKPEPAPTPVPVPVPIPDPEVIPMNFFILNDNNDQTQDQWYWWPELGGEKGTKAIIPGYNVAGSSAIVIAEGSPKFCGHLYFDRPDLDAIPNLRG